MIEFIESAEEFYKPSPRRIITAPYRDGKHCRIRNLTAGEMRNFRVSLSNSKGELIQKRAAKLQELLVAQCICNATGDRLITDEQAMSPDADLPDGGPMAALFARCKEHTGFGADSDWKAIEDAAKNSEATGTS